MILAQVSMTDPIFIGDFWGFVLALPTTLFVAFWISSGSIKHPIRGISSACLGALLGFFVILGWVGTLFSAKPLPNVNGVATFFGSFLLCSVLGIMACIFTDTNILRRSVSHVSSSWQAHLEGSLREQKSEERR